MKAYYGELMQYSSDAHKRVLIEKIDASQKGNESLYPNDIEQFPVSEADVEADMEFIGRDLFVEKK